MKRGMIMLGQKDRRRNFFDDEILARMIPPDHPLVMIKQPIDFGFVEETVRPPNRRAASTSVSRYSRTH